MTMPDAVVRAELVIDSSHAAADLRKALTEAEVANRKDVDRIGSDTGSRFSKAIRTEVERAAPDIVAPLARALGGVGGVGGRRRRLGINLPGDFFTVERAVSGLRRTLTRTFSGANMTKFFSGLGSGIWQGISSGIGSIANVGGKSPLIGILIPVFGTIGALIAGAIQGLYELTALLYAIPNILFAIGLQAGVLFLIFGNLVQKMATVFQAKNAKELEEALKQLNPEVAKFVKGILPFRDLIKGLQDLAQTSFFREFGQTLAVTLKQLGPSLGPMVTDIAGALGRLFKTITEFFGSPLFIIFFEKISESTTKWLDGFSKAFDTFLVGFHRFAISVQDSGFIDKFGQKFNGLIAKIGGWFDDLANDPAFQQWLLTMLDAIQYNLLPALLQLGRALKQFTKALSAAGGDNLLDALTDMLWVLTNMLGDPMIIKGLRLFLGLLIALTASFIGLVGALLWFLGLIETVFEWIFRIIDGLRGFHREVRDLPQALATLGAAAVNAFSAMFGAIGATISDFVHNTIPGWANSFLTLFTDTIPDAIHNFLFNTIPDQVKNFITGFFSADNPMFVNAGSNIMHGLAAGVRAAIPALVQAVRDGLQAARDNWPFSPAKTGPLSGSGDPMLAGQNIMGRLATGITMGAPTLEAASASALSNIFMPGSIAVGFHGALPSQAQAFGTGGAVGRGILGQLQDTRLGVRTL